MAPPGQVTVLDASDPPPTASRRRVWTLRTLSAVVVLAALSYTVLQASECLHRYSLEPVLTTRLLRSPGTLPLPAFTLCNPALDGYLTNNYDNRLSALPWAKDGNRTLPIFLYEAFPPFNVSFVGCQLLGQPCEELGAWRQRHTSGFGLCSTFVPSGGVLAHQVGDGYSIRYAHEAWYTKPDILAVQEGVTFWWQDQAERRLLVFLHAPHEPFTPLPWVQQLAVMEVTVGATARGRIELMTERHLSRRRAPCRGRTGHSRVHCLERCLSGAALRAANASCRTIDIKSEEPLCSTAAEYSRLLLRYNQVAAPAGRLLATCHRRCPPACQVLHFRPLPVPYGSRLSDPEHPEITHIHISYASKQVEYVEQSWAYDTSALMGEVGGFVGIMLGVSVVSVMQLLRDSLAKAADKLMV